MIWPNLVRSQEPGLSGLMTAPVRKGVFGSGAEYCNMLMSHGGDINTSGMPYGPIGFWAKLYCKMALKPYSFAPKPELLCAMSMC